MTKRDSGELGREIERLLGPDGPELDCDQCFEQLDAYVELEVTGAGADAAMPAMRAHLTGCSACSDDHDSLLAFVLADPADPA